MAAVNAKVEEWKVSVWQMNKFRNAMPASAGLLLCGFSFIFEMTHFTSYDDKNEFFAFVPTSVNQSYCNMWENADNCWELTTYWDGLKSLTLKINQNWIQNKNSFIVY